MSQHQETTARHRRPWNHEKSFYDSNWTNQLLSLLARHCHRWSECLFIFFFHIFNVPPHWVGVRVMCCSVSDPAVNGRLCWLTEGGEVGGGLHRGSSVSSLCLRRPHAHTSARISFTDFTAQGSGLDATSAELWACTEHKLDPSNVMGQSGWEHLCLVQELSLKFERVSENNCTTTGSHAGDGIWRADE